MLAPKILPFIPPHHCYVEAFGGGGAVMLAKEPSKVEVYNDIDTDLVDFLKVFHNPLHLKQLTWLCRHHPYSRFHYKRMVKEYHTITEPVMKAYQWFSIIRMSFNSFFGKSGVTMSSSRNGAAQYQDAVDIFPALAK